MYENNDKILTVCFDVETNGFHGINTFSQLHHIIEFGAQWGSGTDERFSSFVNTPNLILHPNSTKIHNITPAMLIDAPDFNTMWATFKSACGFDQYHKVYMVAHNCFYFDKIMMEKELHGQCSNIVWVDSLMISRQIWYSLTRDFTLKNLYMSLTNMELEGSYHRVEYDTMLLWELVNNHLLQSHPTILERYSFDKLSLDRIRYVGQWYRKNLVRFGLKSKEDIVEHVKGDAHTLDNFLYYKIGVRHIISRYMIIYQVLNCTANELVFGYDAVDQYLLEWSKGPIESCKALRGKSYMKKK